MEHTLFSSPEFKIGKEVTVTGTCTEDGEKFTFGSLGTIQEVRHTPKRGLRYAVKLYGGTVKLFYQKSVHKYKPTFIISSIL